MVLGLGTDIIEIARVEVSIQRFGERFLHRVFTEAEIRYCVAKSSGSGQSFAARFAAKEAAAKALGTGISRGVAWREIEVRRSPGEPPRLHWTGRAADRAQAMGVQRASISISHSRTAALAVVLLEG